MHSAILKLLTAVLASALILSGCGGSSSSNPAATEAPAAAAQTATEAPATSPADAPTVAAAEAATTDTGTVTGTGATTGTSAVAEGSAMTTSEASTATESMTATESASATSPATSTDAAPAGVALATRTFTIDPAQSSVSYQVDEEFLGQNLGFVKTVGKTSTIDGSIDIGVDNGTIALGDNQFTVDLRTLTSDSGRRDNAIKDRWLESNKYPWAVFKATEVSDVSPDAALGQDVSFKLKGDLTVREIPLPVVWDVTAKLDGDTLTGTATTLVKMADYGFDAPDIAGMLKVTDGVTLTLNFVANAAQ